MALPLPSPLLSLTLPSLCRADTCSPLQCLHASRRSIDPSLITTLERYHDNHINTDCRAYKLLGIYLDEHLTLNAHTNHIVSKLSRSLYCIKQAKHIVPAKGLKSLYFALIHSHLTYCTSIMSGTTQKNRQKIIKIQKKPSAL